jgi:hypothetical protein
MVGSRTLHNIPGRLLDFNAVQRGTCGFIVLLLLWVSKV